jgi:hypothetical protein
MSELIDNLYKLLYVQPVTVMLYCNLLYLPTNACKQS